MKVEIYPAYYINNWCTMLRAEDKKTKTLEGKENDMSRENLYLTALLSGLEELKFPVEIDIYTQLKSMGFAIGEKRLNYWAKNDWHDMNGDMNSLCL